MREIQCDESGVSGGLGEPRLGLKLWCDSVLLRQDNSSKSCDLCRDLPYREMLIGFDLCMFMREGVGDDSTESRRWTFLPSFLPFLAPRFLPGRLSDGELCATVYCYGGGVGEKISLHNGG